MNINSLKLIDSDRGRELLARYGDYKDKDLEMLMFKVALEEREMMRVVVTLAKLRHKAKDKFSQAAKMFFTSDGAEQSTGELIARHIASRFGKNNNIVDLTSSIGGNLIYLAQENNLTAIDRSEANLFCAQKNAAVYGVANKIKFVLGDAFENIDNNADAFFFDPERAREGQSKTRSILNASPNLVELLPKIFAVTHNVGIKISPAFDYSEIALLPEEPEIEIISEDNVCKVAMLWFGKFKTCQRRATMFIKDTMVSSESVETEAGVAIKFSSIPLAYIYEPNKALIKAHLINEIAQKFSLQKMDPDIAYLTSDKLVKNNIFRTMKVLEYGDYSLKKVQAMVKENEAIKKTNRANIISRGFPISNEELYKRLKLKEGGPLFLIFTTLKGKRYYILTRNENFPLNR